MAVDLIDTIVHLFTEEAREEYKIEEIWANRETYFEELVPTKKAAPKKEKAEKKPAAKKETKKPAAKKTTKAKK